MKIVTVNVNGIRAAAKKGFFEWMEALAPDVVCMQETRALQEQLVDQIFFPAGYELFLLPAMKRGYSGVGIYTKQVPSLVEQGFEHLLSIEEGRYLEAHFGDLIVASLYLPSGSSSEEVQEKKYRFMDGFNAHLEKLRLSGKRCIICGDWNIAHKPIDLTNWKANQKYSGFLPEERAWMDTLFGNNSGWVDGFRAVNQDAEEYTWWSNRGKAWEKNVGWRIDYQVVSESLKSAINGAYVYKDQRFSDHAPLVMDYSL